MRKGGAPHVTDAETRRWVTVDPHPPDRFRVFGPLMNYQFFYDAFGIKAWFATVARS